MGGILMRKEANGIVCPVPKVEAPVAPLLNTISGFLVCDKDASETNTTGDTPMPDVTVQLRQGGTTIATMSTDINGEFTFPNLPDGTYRLRIDGADPDIGLKLLVTKDAGADDTIDSDFDDTTLETDDITVTGGVTDDSIGGVMDEPAPVLYGDICVELWCDEDDSDTRNAGDTSVTGESVTFTPTGGTAVTVPVNAVGKAVYTPTSDAAVTIQIPTSITVGADTKTLLDASTADSDFDALTGQVIATPVVGTVPQTVQGGYFAPDCTVAINIVNRHNVPAYPEAIMFEAVADGFDADDPTLIYDPRFHMIDYTWDFGDPGTFSRLDRTENTFKNSNVAIGPIASHTYRAAGTYTVTLTAKERASGKTVTTTQSITVGDQDAAFPGDNTIFIDTTGAGTGAPAGADVRTSLAAATGLLQASQSAPKRVMFRGGQTHSWTGINAQGGSNYPSMYFVGEPGAPRPQLSFSGQTLWTDPANSQGVGGKDFVMSGFDISTNYDSTTGANLPGVRFMLLFSGTDSLGNFTAHDVDLDGMPIFLENSTPSPQLFITMNDSSHNDWAYSGFLSDIAGGVAVTGVQTLHDENALAGRGTGNNLLGFFRGDAAYGVFYANEGFVRHGWVENNPSIHTTQAWLRWNNRATAGDKLVVARNFVEAGFSTVEVQQTNNTGVTAMNALIEANHLTCNSFANDVIRTQHAGITARNNVLVVPDNQVQLNNPRAGMVSDQAGASSTAAMNDAPVLFYNNTILNHKTAGNYNGAPSLIQDLRAVGISGSREVLSTNNIIHQPSVAGGTADAPLDMSTLFNSRWRDYRDNNTGPIAGTGSPLTGTIVSGQVQAGSAAIGDADLGDDRMVPCRDFFGNVRPADASRGAFEPRGAAGGTLP